MKTVSDFCVFALQWTYYAVGLLSNHVMQGLCFAMGLLCQDVVVQWASNAKPFYTVGLKCYGPAMQAGPAL